VLLVYPPPTIILTHVHLQASKVRLELGIPRRQSVDLSLGAPDVVGEVHLGCLVRALEVVALELKAGKLGDRDVRGSDERQAM